MPPTSLELVEQHELLNHFLEKNVHIKGYSEDATTSNVPIENAVTALGLPDGKTLILHDNDGTVLSNKNNTLASEKQMEANGVIC